MSWMIPSPVKTHGTVWAIRNETIYFRSKSMIWQIFWWNWKFEANVEMLWVLYQSPLFFHSSSKVVHFCPPQPKLESQQRHILPSSLWKKSHKRPWKICVCPLKCVNMVSYASLPFQEIKPFWVLLGVGQKLACFKFTEKNRVPSFFVHTVRYRLTLLKRLRVVLPTNLHVNHSCTPSILQANYPSWRI